MKGLARQTSMHPGWESELRSRFMCVRPVSCIVGREYLCLLAVLVVKVKGEPDGVSSVEGGGVKVLFLLIHPFNKLLENTGREGGEKTTEVFLLLAKCTN